VDRRFLNGGDLFSSTSISEIEGLHSSLTQPARMYALDDGPVTARVSLARFQNAELFYTEISGNLINASAMDGNDFVIGILLAGSVELFQNHTWKSYRPNDGMIFLPGDTALIVLRSARTFSLRLSGKSETYLKIKALPFKDHERFERTLGTPDATDFSRLLRFCADEFDRLHASGQTASPQIEALGKAIWERARAQMQSMLRLQGSDPAHVEICSDVDTFLAQHPMRKLVTQELAEIAHCSVRQLYRAFQSVTDLSPGEYALRTRGEYALRTRLFRARSRLLSSVGNGRVIGLIARQHGFSSSSKFSEAYSREFGETPSRTLAARLKMIDELRG